ncbi:Uncharacterised protein [Mycobacteroides abscessus subsp. abscessus]|nr:Uncharacterised protein [Mycobacteroides abscessus subsp. abscessus]
MPHCREDVCASTSSFTLAWLRPVAAATRGICSAAYSGVISGSSPEPEPVTASAGTRPGVTRSRAAMVARRASISAFNFSLLGPWFEGAPAAGSPLVRVWK